MLDKVLRRSALALLRFYQLMLSPWFGRGCRFTPTCSQYAVDAYNQHTSLKATGFVIYRLCRCHPLGGHGYDPVPCNPERFAHE